MSIQFKVLIDENEGCYLLRDKNLYLYINKDNIYMRYSIQKDYISSRFFSRTKLYSELGKVKNSLEDVYKLIENYCYSKDGYIEELRLGIDNKGIIKISFINFFKRNKGQLFYNSL